MSILSEYKNCVRKKRFKSWREAEEKAVQLWNVQPHSFNIYRCKVCLDYHLTKKNSKAGYMK